VCVGGEGSVEGPDSLHVDVWIRVVLEISEPHF